MVATEQCETPIDVVVTGADGERQTHRLAPGRSVLVGASKDCGLRVQGPGISACHCLLSFEDGQVWVQDWASKTGTLLNDQPVEAKITVAHGDRLRIGDYQLSTAAISESPFGGTGRNATTVAATPYTSAVADPSHGQDVDLPHPESTLLPDDPWEFDAAEPMHGSQPNTAYQEESFEQETIALLREEIDSLQGLLAERDARIAEISGADREYDRDGADSPETGSENALARVDQLLDEAARGDERVAALEEMLCAAEEANQAEQEERRQLEAWVGDIEVRIRQRDGRRDAELETLRRSLEESIEQRDQAQLQLKQAATLGNAPKYYEESLNQLQRQNKDLQTKIAELTADRTKLLSRLENASERDDEVVRAERAAIAQERAIVSRLRSELANKLSALEDSPKPMKAEASDAAMRLQALREHLREIHQEQQDQPMDTATGLAGRITRLWKRVEQ